MPFVLLHREHSYCKSCFYEHTSHKFRATIGKSKFPLKGKRVLLAVSGGPASSVMVQLTKDNTSLPNKHRRLQFIPSLIHVDESACLADATDSCEADVRDWLLSHQLDCFFTSLAKSFRRSDASFYTSSDGTNSTQSLLHDAEEEGQLQELLASLQSASAKEEVMRQLRMRLLVDVAVAEGFDAVFLGGSASRLSIQLITDVAQGKGSQIDMETVR